MPLFFIYNLLSQGLRILCYIYECLVFRHRQCRFKRISKIIDSYLDGVIIGGCADLNLMRGSLGACLCWLRRILIAYCSCLRLLWSVIAIEPMLFVYYTVRHCVSCPGGTCARQKSYSITLLQIFSDLDICPITLGTIHNYLTVLLVTMGIVSSIFCIVVFLFSYHYKVFKWV
jgi:hypothetical protein